jgi:hypothetical protein
MLLHPEQIRRDVIRTNDKERESFSGGDNGGDRADPFLVKRHDSGRRPCGGMERSPGSGSLESR